MKRAFTLLSLLAVINIVSAVGPKIPCILTWTPNPPAEQVTGYWFYWRGSTNTPYSDAQRVAVPSAAFNVGYDLRVLGLPKGAYYVVMTATNAYGESDPSDEFCWRYENPNKPSNVNVRTQ